MEEKIANIMRRCFVNIPFTEFDRYRPLISRYRINPEIGLDNDALYSSNSRDFKNISQFLSDHGLRSTLHAPFQDMLPGARDKYVLQAVRNKLRRCFEVIEVIRPCSVVCHLGYLDPVHSYQFDEWLETSLDTWRELITIAEPFATPIMFENTYEKDPGIHKIVLESLGSPLARFCLDVGHLLAFAHASWQDWLTTLGHWLGQLHLHDNNGLLDEHLPVGKGNFDFEGLFSHLKSNKFTPIITLEPRSESDLWESLNTLDRLTLFDHK